MSTKVLMTKSMGMLLAEVTETVEGNYKLKDVVVIQQTQQGATLYPLLTAVEEKEITIKVDELVTPDLLTPHKELYNNYNKMFHKGIELITT